jgi:hypothetical protein
MRALSTFRSNVVTPCSESQSKPSKQPEELNGVTPCFDYSLTPKMEVLCYPETSLNFTRLHSATSQEIMVLERAVYGIFRHKTNPLKCLFQSPMDRNSWRKVCLCGDEITAACATPFVATLFPQSGSHGNGPFRTWVAHVEFPRQ